MHRPDFITNEDIGRWSLIIDNDSSIPEEMKQSTIIREVCYAGLFLAEELDKLDCPPEIIVRIQYTAGQLSFGRDMWEVHLEILQDYKDNKLVFEDDNDNLKN